jgi:hypothetical protein
LTHSSYALRLRARRDTYAHLHTADVLMSVLDELAWRGLLQDATEGAREHLDEPRSVYIGFDPTAE